MKTYGPTMQCNKSPLINRLINDCLAVNEMLPQLINISQVC